MIGRFVKPVNALLVGCAYLKSSLTSKVIVTGMPVAISAELTNHCNLQCPECLSGSGQMKRRRGFMDIGLFRRLISELQPYLYNINLFFQGEPMLHPQFFSFTGNNSNIHTVVSTNGHFLSEENAEKIVKSGLSKLIVSLDGMDQDTYSHYRRGGNLDTVINGIRKLDIARKRHKSSLKLEIQFLVTRKNELQIPEIRRFAHKVRAIVNFKSMQITNKNDIEAWLPSRSKYRRYEEIHGEYVIRNAMPNRCARLWFNPVITWDGKVVPCCFDKDAEYVMGDLNNDSFRDIWNGTKYAVFRKSILTGRHTTRICRNCTSGLKWSINR